MKKNEIKETIKKIADTLWEDDFCDANELLPLIAHIQLKKYSNGNIGIAVHNDILNPDDLEMSVDEFIKKFA